MYPFPETRRRPSRNHSRSSSTTRGATARTPPRAACAFSISQLVGSSACARATAPPRTRRKTNRRHAGDDNATTAAVTCAPPAEKRLGGEVKGAGARPLLLPSIASTPPSVTPPRRPPHGRPTCSPPGRRTRGVYDRPTGLWPRHRLIITARPPAAPSTPASASRLKSAIFWPSPPPPTASRVIARIARVFVPVHHRDAADDVIGRRPADTPSVDRESLVRLRRLRRCCCFDTRPVSVQWPSSSTLAPMPPRAWRHDVRSCAGPLLRHTSGANHRATAQAASSCRPTVCRDRLSRDGCWHGLTPALTAAAVRPAAMDGTERGKTFCTTHHPHHIAHHPLVRVLVVRRSARRDVAFASPSRSVRVRPTGSRSVGGARSRRLPRPLDPRPLFPVIGQRCRRLQSSWHNVRTVAFCRRSHDMNVCRVPYGIVLWWWWYVVKFQYSRWAKLPIASSSTH